MLDKVIEEVQKKIIEEGKMLDERWVVSVRDEFGYVSHTRFRPELWATQSWVAHCVVPEVISAVVRHLKQELMQPPRDL